MKNVQFSKVLQPEKAVLTFLLPPLREPGPDAFMSPGPFTLTDTTSPSPTAAWSSGPVTTYVSPLRSVHG